MPICFKEANTPPRAFRRSWVVDSASAVTRQVRDKSHPWGGLRDLDKAGLPGPGSPHQGFRGFFPVPDQVVILPILGHDRPADHIDELDHVVLVGVEALCLLDDRTLAAVSSV